MLIRSDPPGAVVVLNRGEFPPGVTPLEVPFDHHGTFAVHLEKEGYRSLDTRAPVPTPWYGIPPFDFVAELLLPWTIRDHHEFRYVLEPRWEATSLEEAARGHEEILKRAEEFRREVKESVPAEER